MIDVIVRLRVEDFDRWHAEYERMHPVRERHGERGRTLFRDLEDPNTVVGVFRWDSIERARGYFASAELSASVDRARGRGAPVVSYLTEHRS